MILKQVILNVFIWIFIFSNINCFAQYSSDSKKAIQEIEKGISALQAMQYDDAIEAFQKTMKIDPEFAEAYLYLGEVYYEKADIEKYIYYYEQGLKINPFVFPKGHLFLADILLSNGEYNKALENYLTYQSHPKFDKSKTKELKNKIERCKFAIYLVSNPVDFNPYNLGEGVNSQYDEYWPSLSADEAQLVFTRLLPRNPNLEYNMNNAQEDFFISLQKDTTWATSKSIGKPINTSEYNEGAQTLAVDGSYMFYTACNRPDGNGLCDIFYSKKTGEKWSEPKNIGEPINTKHREKQPSISSNGQFLYFSSDRPSGKGGMDIWVSQKSSNGKWLPPKNLGDSINTSGNEIAPFIHADNQTLYFASDKHLGLGGFDLFKSSKDSLGNWEIPVNIGYPVNTYKDEISLIVNAKGNKAYFAANREPRKDKDIYAFDLPESIQPVPVSYMKGRVYDAYTMESLKANFELIDLFSSDTINSATSNSDNGEFLVCIPTNKDYALNVSKKGYLFYSDNFSLKGIFNADKPFLKDVPLHPIKEGEKIVLKNIFFGYNSYELLDASVVELNSIIKFLALNSLLKVEIGGHTDNTGTSEYNLLLSEQRAEAVYEYLINNGIKTDRLSYKGYGETEPTASNETPEGKANNRRTELKILKVK